MQHYLRILPFTACIIVLSVFALPASAHAPQPYRPYGYSGFHGMSAPVYPPMPQQRFESFQPGIIPASNYGAGFIPSPNLYLGYQPQFPFGGYGAGFIPSPVPWYGYGIGASLSFLF